MVPSHRRALRARLLSFRLLDEIVLEGLRTFNVGGAEAYVTAGVNPAYCAWLGNTD